jgi:4-carboxymuconolactone decarboxylase
MARLPYVDPSEASEPVRTALEGMPPLNIFRMIANAETALRPFLRFGNALLAHLELNPLLRELAILQVSRLTPHAEYEWVQHVPIALAVGVTQEQVDALEHGDPQAASFTELQYAVLRFTREVVRDARASDEAFDAVRAALSPREIVELLMVIGQYMMLARVMATVDMELDDPAASAVIDASTAVVDRPDQAS